MKFVNSGEKLSKSLGRGQRSDCATWLQKAKELPKEEFKQELERPLRRRETQL